ncbi:MAG: terminase [Planctomycetaceae bacterium]|nr:MAG: terminase [Planctomycetaceae bacterium]
MPELFYGGAAGGGKSDFLLGDFLQDVTLYGKAWKGILFRRTYPELEELISRSKEIYPQTGAKWSDQKKLWTWPNGANLKMRYAERNDDVLRYQGHQYTWVGWDELTQWPTLFCYRYLRSRLRSAHHVPTKRIRSAANPGGPGHLEVKRYFVDPAPGGYKPLIDEDTGIERIFIPARLKDNLILSIADPEYRQRLKGLGSSTLVRALLEGDWSVIEGAFFDGWSDARHVIRPFEIPAHWLRFRSMDWGFASPFSVGWQAVVGDEYAAQNLVGDPITLPRGCLVRYREWYGRNKDYTGLRLTAEEVARGIVKRETREEADGTLAHDLIGYSVLDPSAFKEDGGPSIAERMFTSTNGRANFRRADNTRVAARGAFGGWDQVRARLVGEAEDRPMLVVFSTCADLIRTLPVLQHDPDKAEDLDTNSEDHAADDIRYACMSRPWVQVKPKPKVTKIDNRMPTYDELWKEHDREKEFMGERI